MIIIAILVGFLIIGAILSDGTEPKSEYKPSEKIVLFKNWKPDNTGGLRWMGNKKRTRKKKKYFWD